ncbi:nuclear transport factor 2 family protein [Terriglobus sp.]|uniref:nuclear transport factor 2 family protein n=1 Tax=Terriglobus sp. TaxID=1889013 RepID=UPI003AFFE72E
MRYAMGKLRTQSGLIRLLCLALLCPAVLVLLAPAARALSIRPHRPGHGDQQQVLRVDDQIRTALLAADTGTLERFLADDFLGISANGTLSDKQQYLRRIGKHEHQFSRINITDRKIRVQTSSAVVVTTADVTGKLDNIPVSGIFRYTRVYSRGADGLWRLRNFEATRVHGAGSDEMRHGEPVATRK